MEQKELLINIGKYCIDNTKYDSVGLSEDEKTLSVGFQLNPLASLMLTFDKDNKLQVSFHTKVSKYEAFGIWFQMLEHIKCDVVICNDFK